MPKLCVHQLSKLCQIIFVCQEWSEIEIYEEIASLILNFYFIDHVFMSHMICKHMTKSEKDFISGLNLSKYNKIRFKQGNSQVQFPELFLTRRGNDM